MSCSQASLEIIGTLIPWLPRMWDFGHEATLPGIVLLLEMTLGWFFLELK